MARLLAAVYVVVALAGCRGDAVRGAPDLARLERAPDGGVLPEAVVDNGTVHLVSLHGSAEAADVQYRRRSLGDTAWTAPIAVDDTPGTGLAVGTVRGAHLAVGRRGLVHVLWNGSSAAQADAAGGAPLLYARVDGRRVTPARNVMTDSVSLDGGSAIAADADGHVFILWHAVARHGLRDAERTVYLTTSDDDGEHFGPARVVSPTGSGACACCGMAAIARAGSPLLWMFRAATDDRGRDLHVMQQTSDGPSAVLLEDPWDLEACPLSTSAMATSPLGVLAAWETRGHIVHASVADDGREPARPRIVPGGNGRRRHPAVARNTAGDVLLAWTDGAAWGRGGDLEWVVQERGSDRELGGGRVASIPTWTKPSAYAVPDGTFVLLY